MAAAIIQEYFGTANKLMLDQIVQGWSAGEIIGTGGTSIIKKINLNAEFYNVKKIKLKRYPVIAQNYQKYKNEIILNLHLTKNMGDYVSKCIGGIRNNSDVYIIYRYLDGSNLGNYIYDNPISIDEIVSITDQLKTCINELHKLNIIHNDIGIPNIFYTTDKRILLIDFGGAINITETNDYVKYLYGIELLSIQRVFLYGFEKFYKSNKPYAYKISNSIKTLTTGLLYFVEWRDIVDNHSYFNYITKLGIDSKCGYCKLGEVGGAEDLPLVVSTASDESTLEKYISTRTISLDEMNDILTNLIIGINSIHCKCKTLREKIDQTSIIYTDDKKILFKNTSEIIDYTKVVEKREEILKYQKNLFDIFSLMRYLLLHTFDIGTPEYTNMEHINRILDNELLPYEETIKEEAAPIEDYIQLPIQNTVPVPAATPKRKELLRHRITSSHSVPCHNRPLKIAESAAKNNADSKKRMRRQNGGRMNKTKKNNKHK